MSRSSPASIQEWRHSIDCAAAAISQMDRGEEHLNTPNPHPNPSSSELCVPLLLVSNGNFVSSRREHSAMLIQRTWRGFAVRTNLVSKPRKVSTSGQMKTRPIPNESHSIPKFQSGRTTAFGSLPRKTNLLKQVHNLAKNEKLLSALPDSSEIPGPRCRNCCKETATLSNGSDICFECKTFFSQEVFSVDPLSPTTNKRKHSIHLQFPEDTSAALDGDSLTEKELQCFTDGFSQGFLSGMRYNEQKAITEATQHVQELGTLESSDPGVAIMRRRPYRFCTKCWIVHKQWVLKSLKLPNGSVRHLHPEVCPAWKDQIEEPTKAQVKLYGAAFKRAQRTSVLRDTALKEFRIALPNASASELHKYLMT